MHTKTPDPKVVNKLELLILHLSVNGMYDESGTLIFDLIMVSET